MGRSINSLHVRIDGRRSKSYELVDGRTIDESNDDYSLGIHLLVHGPKHHADFENSFKTFIFGNCSPMILEEREHKYVHLLKTLRSLGLSTVNPFGEKN